MRRELWWPRGTADLGLGHVAPLLPWPRGTVQTLGSRVPSTTTAGGSIWYLLVEGLEEVLPVDVTEESHSLV